MLKYESGYKQEWENAEILEKAKKQADFYLSKTIGIPVVDGKINLIHFFENQEVISDKRIKNKSPFYDCDKDWLSSVGFDASKSDTEFDQNIGYIVAVPVDSLKEWVGTKSWIKLSRAGVLDNAVIFSVPLKEAIFRDHTFIEKSFIDSNNTKLVKDYYKSTSSNNQHLEMPEVWIPNEVQFGENQLLHFND